MGSHSIPIHSALDQAGCSACLPDPGQESCHRIDWPRCLAPALSGPLGQLQHVLAAIETDLVTHFGLPAGIGSLVQALTLDAGEAELVLTVGRRCGGELIADRAFQTLRRMLPDTDIYVACSGA